jgi:hypothetical protein
VAAAGQAEVAATDPQPAVGGGIGKHLVEELAVGLLEGIALDQRAPRLGEAPGERVADLLELAQVEYPRRSRSGDPVRHDDASETLGDQPGELTLELGDLPAQLGAGAGFAGQPVDFGSPLGDQGQPVGLRSPVEQIRHGLILSRLEGRCSNP